MHAANPRRLGVRRLAAIDLHGRHGTGRRRTLIVLEFLAASIGGPVLGVYVGGVLGWWIVGVALNYLPLLVHALTLLPGASLDAELAGVDIDAELRHYSVAQLWVALPLLFVVLALAQGAARPGPRRTRRP